MLKHDATFVEKGANAAYEGFRDRPHFFDSVGFLGLIDGVIYLCIPDDFVQNAAGRVLGMSAAEIKMSGDLIREVGPRTDPACDPGLRPLALVCPIPTSGSPCLCG
jgi:hypothetical protein